MERFINKFVLKVSVKKYYQRLPSEDTPNELKKEQIQEMNTENIPTQTESKLTPPSSTKLFTLIKRGKIEREANRGKYTQLEANCNLSKEEMEEIYNNNFTD
ncbi:hypothetical protein LOD99_14740 [Oopsacas minuta]|uniref:Uncharacterized protein n=1 Tax=Oopsacas minuta TaxID=111878 RepID=A0AAV7KEL5_9METZ|nr:hypothetical protein LOD99_14740 [Oopsacas minuta]